jgi:membrane protein DedA with SNARE-associated domain
MDILDQIRDLLLAPIEGYRWLVRQSVTLARDLFQQYGYLVVFLGTCLENTLFLGLFIPGILVLLLAGISANDGLISFPLAFVIGVAGTSLGDTVSYAAGRFGWKRALDHMGKVPWMDTMRTALSRHPGLFVLSYHFMGYTRLVGPIMAGAVRLPFRKWWLLDFGGAVLWVGAYMSLGVLFGRLGFTLDAAEDNVRRLEWLIAGLAIVAIVVWLLLRRRAERGGPPAVLEALADDGSEREPDPDLTRR